MMNDVYHSVMSMNFRQAFIEACTCMSMVWREADFERGRDVEEPLRFQKWFESFLRQEMYSALKDTRDI